MEVQYRKRSPVSYKVRPGRKSATIPDQSMSIKEIVQRFTRNLPVDGVAIKRPVYLDQDNVDFESLSRLDNVDKAYEATLQRDEAKRIASEIKENERRRQEEESEREQAEQKAQQSSGAERPGIDTLDNTMPDDTDHSNRQLRKGGGKKQNL